MKPVQVMTLSVSASATAHADAAILRRASDSLRAAGFEVAHERALGRDAKVVQELAQRFAGELDAIVVLGGEGLSHTDTVPEALRELFEQEVPGFGERFRSALALQPDGDAHAMATRATAGILSACTIFLLPCSEAGLEFGIERLIVPFLNHSVATIRVD